MRDAIFTNLRPGAVLRVHGSDAFTFLQGQLANDLRSQSPRPVTYGLWLNTKGKVQADSFVLQHSAAEFTLVSLACAAPELRARLEAFIIADDVVLEDATEASEIVLVAGSDSDALLEGVPSTGEYMERFAGHLFRGPPHTNVWIGSRAAAEAFANTLSAAGAVRSDPREFERRRILAGVPAVPADIGPTELPQEGGLEHTAVSFNKGCYLGQEVMARLHAMGQVRRTLVAVEGSGPPPVGPAQIFQTGKPVGELRSRCTLADDRFAGLAIVQRTALAAPSPLSLGADGSRPLRVTGTSAAS